MDRLMDVVAEVDRTIEEFRGHGCFEPLFRGHSNGSWELVPSLGRKDFEENFENSIFYDFLTFAAPHLQPGCNDWDILFAMRHHGLPTRLLDWSQSFAVALYFAINGDFESPNIWILDPYRLNLHSTRQEAIKHPKDLDSYTDYFIEEPSSRKPSPGPIFSILASKNSPRLLAQRGMFTLHSDLTCSLERMYPDCIKKIDIPNTVGDEARKFLRLAGCDTYSVYPDLDGLARWLNESYSVEQTPPRPLTKSATGTSS